MTDRSPLPTVSGSDPTGPEYWRRRRWSDLIDTAAADLGLSQAAADLTEAARRHLRAVLTKDRLPSERRRRRLDAELAATGFDDDALDSMRVSLLSQLSAMPRIRALTLLGVPPHRARIALRAVDDHQPEEFRSADPDEDDRIQVIAQGARRAVLGTYMDTVDTPTGGAIKASPFLTEAAWRIAGVRPEVAAEAGRRGGEDKLWDIPLPPFEVPKMSPRQEGREIRKAWWAHAADALCRPETPARWTAPKGNEPVDETEGRDA